MLRVSAQFGNYVKFVIQLPELKDPKPVLLPNVFAIMKASVTVTTIIILVILVVIIGASLSVPHSRELNGDFCNRCNRTYVIP